jgi:hypothetical protein
MKTIFVTRITVVDYNRLIDLGFKVIIKPEIEEDKVKFFTLVRDNQDKIVGLVYEKGST